MTILVLACFCLITVGLNAQNDNTLLAQQSVTGENISSETPRADTAYANQLLQRANYLYNLNRFDSLSILAHQASSIFEEKKAWTDYIEAQLLVSTDLYLKNEMEAAKKLSGEILQISQEKLGEKHFATAKAYMQEGILALADIKPKVALDYFTVAHNILADAPGQTTTIARLYNLIAFIHYEYNEDAERALNYCQAALTISKNQLDSSDGTLGNVYSEVGILYAELEKYDLALSTFEKALKIYYRNYSANLMAVATVNYNMGLIKVAEEEYEEAISFYEKALELILLTSGGENQLAVKIYSKIGQLYLSKLNDRAAGMPYLKNAISISKKINNVTDPAIEYRYRILGKYYLGE